MWLSWLKLIALHSISCPDVFVVLFCCCFLLCCFLKVNIQICHIFYIILVIIKENGTIFENFLVSWLLAQKYQAWKFSGHFLIFFRIFCASFCWFSECCETFCPVLHIFRKKDSFSFLKYLTFTLFLATSCSLQSHREIWWSIFPGVWLVASYRPAIFLVSLCLV